MEETVNYRGFDIEISREEDSMCPFTDWDGCAPLMFNGGRSWGEDYSKGEILEYLTSYLTYNQVKRNQSRLLKMMDYDVEDFKMDYPYDRTEMIKDDILYNWLGEGINNMEKFCIEFDIKHYRGESTGYSQGDWVEVFMCWTPEFGEMTGRSYESMNKETFKADFKLFSDWAWGNVYWFNIDDEGGNHVDSCGGYYGDDHEESGLMETARDSIDYYLEKQKKEKFKKVKTFIKNRVPLDYRTAIA